LGDGDDPDEVAERGGPDLEWTCMACNCQNQGLSGVCHNCKRPVCDPPRYGSLAQLPPSHSSHSHMRPSCLPSVHQSASTLV
jgi:hypothetical protein